MRELPETVANRCHDCQISRRFTVSGTGGRLIIDRRSRPASPPRTSKGQVQRPDVCTSRARRAASRLCRCLARARRRAGHADPGSHCRHGRRRPDRLRRQPRRAVQGPYPGRPSQHHGPQPEPDPRAARGRPAGDDRRHRRDERQPRLRGRPADRRRLVFARPVPARADCRHHAVRRNGRRDGRSGASAGDGLRPPRASGHDGLARRDPPARLRAHVALRAIRVRRSIQRRAGRGLERTAARRDAQADRDAAGHRRFRRRHGRPALALFCRERIPARLRRRSRGRG